MTPPQTRDVGANERLKTGWDAHLYRESKQALRSNTVLLATIDPAIRNELALLLKVYGIEPIWVKGVEEFKENLIREKVAACFCGLWLAGGTYRDVARYVKRQPAEIPFVLLCPQNWSQEQQDFLAALDIPALHFMCYPYQERDLERVLGAKLQSHAGEISVPAVPDNSLDGTAFAFSRLRPSYLGPSGK